MEINKHDLYFEIKTTFEKINGLQVSVDHTYSDVITITACGVPIIIYSLEGGILACGDVPNQDFLVDYLIQDIYRIYDKKIRAELGIPE